MAVINVRADKNIEFVDLEVHAIMCEQRRLALEEKINSVASRLEEYEQQQLANKRLMLGAIVSIATGIATTIVSLVGRHF
jgi:uncharacterized protein (DUF849 family)